MMLTTLNVGYVMTVVHVVKIRSGIFIMRSKADNSQLNLAHCTITTKIMTKNSKTKHLISTGSSQEAMESAPRAVEFVF